MAIAVVYRPPAMTVDQYNATWARDDHQPAEAPRGLLFHAGVGDGDGFFTLTVWDSKEAYDAFAPSFRAMMKARGVELGAPSLLPVHHTIIPSSS